MAKTITSLSGIQQDIQFNLQNPTGATQSPLIQALSYKSKGDCMEILAKYADLNYDKKFNLLLRNGSQQVTLSEVFRYYGFLTTMIKCPHCMKGISTDIIMLHLQKNYQNKGHKFSNQQVIQFFLDEESGKNTDIIFKKNNRPR